MALDKDIEETFLRGCDELGICLSDEQLMCFSHYLVSLSKWNKKMNLTAVDSLHDMVIYHLLDSLVIMPYLVGERVIDVGSGAGLPGIPLAIMFPDKQFTLIDSRVKKTHFLSQMVRDMKLPHVKVVAERVERYLANNDFDVIMTRAFAEPTRVIALTKHLLAKHGRWLLMTGVKPNDLRDLTGLGKVECVELSVPGLSAQRHVIIVDSSSL